MELQGIVDVTLNNNTTGFNTETLYTGGICEENLRGGSLGLDNPPKSYRIGRTTFIRWLRLGEALGCMAL